MATLTIANLIQGPGWLYTGTFGATEPTDAAVNTTPQASAWTDVGGTQDGVTLTVNREYSELEVDQIVDVPERRLTKRDPQLKSNMAEATLENLAVALNGGTVATGSGFKTYDPDMDTAATQPTYKALLFDGYAPGQFRRRVVGRKVLSIESIESSYKKDSQTLWPVTWATHYVSNTTKPFRLIDQTS